MQTIALFGGSFDPPHIAHETVVQEALKIKGVTKVVVMPTFLNPFKKDFFAPSSLRISWLKKIFSSYENVEINSFEVDLQRKVPSIETVLYLLKSYKKIYLIIGADNLKSLNKWHKYEELNSLVSFVVVSRDSITISKQYLTLQVEDTISSTHIRNTLDSQKLSKVCSQEIIQYYKDNHER